MVLYFPTSSKSGAFALPSKTQKHESSIFSLKSCTLLLFFRVQQPVVAWFLHFVELQLIYLVRWAQVSQSPNGILIGSAVSDSQAFQWDGQPPKIAPSLCGICTPTFPLFLSSFPEPTRVSSPNGISIGSIVFAGLMNVINRQTEDRHKHTYRLTTLQSL